MAIPVPRRGVRLLTAIGVLSVIGGVTLFDVYAQRGAPARDGGSRRGGFEVWLADQSDTRAGFGGQLLIYEGTDLMGGNAAKATPIARLDLGAETADLCRAATGRNPVRPHMIAFNREHTHAVLSFVASGHVVIFDAEKRAALNCFQTTVGSTGTRQAHAAFAAPDGSFILVANQNGKRLERIDADFATNTFVHNPAATLDLHDVQDAERRRLRRSGAAADQLADLSDHRRLQQPRLRHAARRRAVRREHEDDADDDRRRVRPRDGQGQRLRRRADRRATCS